MFIPFLLVFPIHLQERLLGEVNRVRVVDNQRSSGVTVAGSESVLVRSLDRERRVSTNRRYHTFWKIGPSLHHVGWLRPVTLTWSHTEESPSDRTLGVSGRA